MNDLRPICVDLDGTLLLTDTLFESVLLYIKENPLRVFMLPLLLLKGRAQLKKEISNSVSLEVDLLPRNEELIDFLKMKKSQGHRIVLATAASESIAKEATRVFSFIDEWVSSDERVNLKGSKKLELLDSKFPKGFDYCGDSKADVPLFKKAEKVVMVNPDSSVKKSVPSDKIELLVETRKNKLKAYVKQIRAYQWVKNLLLFLPLLLSGHGEVLSDSHWIGTVIAFFSFSFCASSIYVCNDLVDLKADRLHPTKRKRPLASGRVSILTGMAMMPILLCVGLALALMVGDAFFGVIIVYLILTTLYSFYLKKVEILDVVMLTSLYTLRIIAGGQATGIYISHWLIVLSLFFFLSLAFMKRAAELLLVLEKFSKSEIEENRLASMGRGYRVEDLGLVKSFGISAGYLSVLVFSLYVSSPHVTALYKSPEILWVMCPILLYWIGRCWIVTMRGKMHSDPIVFALKDKVSIILALLIFLVGVAAKVC